MAAGGEWDAFEPTAQAGVCIADEADGRVDDADADDDGMRAVDERWSDRVAMCRARGTAADAEAQDEQPPPPMDDGDADADAAVVVVAAVSVAVAVAAAAVAAVCATLSDGLNICAKEYDCTRPCLVLECQSR